MIFISFGSKVLFLLRRLPLHTYCCGVFSFAVTQYVDPAMVHSMSCSRRRCFCSQSLHASAGLLHDTVEDTNDVSFEEIGNWFGSAVRRIVEGETRFSKIGKISGMTPGADVKAEDLRQLFLAMTEEVRIIVVKLADRLHNMRTLGSMKPEKQKKIAAETLQVTAQLQLLDMQTWSCSQTPLNQLVYCLYKKLDNALHCDCCQHGAASVIPWP